MSAWSETEKRLQEHVNGKKQETVWSSTSIAGDDQGGGPASAKRPSNGSIRKLHRDPDTTWWFTHCN
jgi:hypothetical protein